MIPYSRHAIDEDDIRAVVDVLRSDWLTTGPKIGEFEKAVADYVGAKFAVAVSSGTAALHCAMHAAGIGPGDEVIVPPMTFAATANCVVYKGGIPVFADVDPDTLLIDPNKAEQAISEKTKAVIAADYAGQPCDYDRLGDIADRNGLVLIADACHSIGAEYKGRKVGTLADMTAFSFHPVKHIATGEGGMVVTDDADTADRLRIFRNHGITADHRQRETADSWFYEMTDLGFNYRITDIQCALGISQLRKLPAFLKRRREIAETYNAAFGCMEGIAPLAVNEDVLHSWHLYVVKIRGETDRTAIFRDLREKGVGVNVHYIPVHLHPYYRRHFHTSAELCPVAESVYNQILSIPVFPKMRDGDATMVIEAIQNAITKMI